MLLPVNRRSSAGFVAEPLKESFQVGQRFLCGERRRRYRSKDFPALEEP
jgi:hypothetical protein